MLVAKTLGVDAQTDREPEQNRFIRSDQYSFIRKGVPALAFNSVTSPARPKRRSAATGCATCTTSPLTTRSSR
jgi:Zn-dependent M28 family amino/carboxypeptidase